MEQVMKRDKSEEDHLSILELALGYSFRDRRLLEEALTHRSFCNETDIPDALDNERFEFFGDAALDFFVTEKLMREFPASREGELSRIRASLVDEPSLAILAERLGLGRFLRLGRGEEKSGGREKRSLLANAYEAVVAAIYLDGGGTPVSLMIERDFSWLMAQRQGERAGTDYKTELQEIVQGRGGRAPVYILKGTAGPDHRREFVVTLLVDGEPIAEGEGKSKKEAEQAAARAALQRLRLFPSADKR
jgi:ribonuclease-3